MSSETHDNLKALIIEVGEIGEEIKKLTDRKAEIEAPLREHMSGVGEILADDFVLKVTSNKGRVTYDYKKMLDDGIDLEPYKKEGAPYTTLSVKRVKSL